MYYVAFTACEPFVLFLLEELGKSKCKIMMYFLYFKYTWLTEVSFATCSFFLLKTKLLQRHVEVMRMTVVRHNVKKPN